MEKLVKMSENNLFNDFFRDKTVLVTGHTGFIGSWLCLWLENLGAKVVGFSLDPPTTPSLFQIIDLQKNILHITGNVLDKSHLVKTLEKYNPELVFHLAAQSLVRTSYEIPTKTFETNIMGTVNILDAIRNTKSVKSCIIMTSDKCYQNLDDGHKHKETDPLGGDDPYSASKGAAEIITNSFRKSFFKPNTNSSSQIGIASVRAGNVIGGGDWSKDRIIPDCINSLIENKKIQVRNPSSIRPWQFVLEPIAGMLWLCKKLTDVPIKFSDAWNLAPNETMDISVKEVVENILKVWNNNNDWEDMSKNSSTHPKESSTLKLDSNKALNSLDWHTVYSFNELISETVDWYRTNLDDSILMRELSINQIKKYSDKAKQMNIMWTRS